MRKPQAPRRIASSAVLGLLSAEITRIEVCGRATEAKRARDDATRKLNDDRPRNLDFHGLSPARPAIAAPAGRRAGSRSRRRSAMAERRKLTERGRRPSRDAAEAARSWNVGCTRRDDQGPRPYHAQQPHAGADGAGIGRDGQFGFGFNRGW